MPRSPAGQLRLDDEDAYYEEILGSGQSDEEEGEARSPRIHRPAAEQGLLDPLVTATSQDIASLIELGPRLRAPARLAPRRTEYHLSLDAICRPDGRTWTTERVVVFTEYAATLDWIARVLAQRGYRDVLATIQGSTPPEDREKIRAQFTEKSGQVPRPRPGSDPTSAARASTLQDHCHRLVNFDIPFNPSRLEQRIGRIDRLRPATDTGDLPFSPPTRRPRPTPRTWTSCGGSRRKSATSPPI